MNFWIFLGSMLFAFAVGAVFGRLFLNGERRDEEE